MVDAGGDPQSPVWASLGNDAARWRRLLRGVSPDARARRILRAHVEDHAPRHRTGPAH
ncbi:hypothetical protein [Streptacidiphilus sp. P02-A3a]|uniref:hypothetical protein n=1 Tax=Streptacidiphilus sp. P02-A3a TaxID=2704468 RepID=UPI0015F7F511|nr:hypothetical protein [Streptacidiphilus sp. P02-A3a]QMU73061.1 hypothetical protein GXP74_37290 [Streptacidiphilus sp. P02-A3a]